jgi:hypothetical protein
MSHLHAKIFLTGDRGKDKTAKIDEHFLSLFSEVNWYLTKDGYAKSSQHGLMHRHVVRLRGGEIEGFMVDHVNGDRLDNTSANLRIVTAKGNAKNKHNDPVHEDLVGVVRVDNIFQTVHKKTTYYAHPDPRMCALCYDSIVWYCYGYGKRVNDNARAPLTIEYWNLPEKMMKELTKIKESYTDFIGVKKVKNGWKASITVDLGVFESSKEAAEAYNKALRAVKAHPKPEEFNYIS